MDNAEVIKRNRMLSKRAATGRKTRKIREKLIGPELEMTAARRAKIRRNFQKALLNRKHLREESESQ